MSAKSSTRFQESIAAAGRGRFVDFGAVVPVGSVAGAALYRPDAETRLLAVVLCVVIDSSPLIEGVVDRFRPVAGPPGAAAWCLHPLGRTHTGEPCPPSRANRLVFELEILVVPCDSVHRDRRTQIQYLNASFWRLGDDPTCRVRFWMEGLVSD